MGRIGFGWLRIESSGGLLLHGNEHSRFMHYGVSVPNVMRKQTTREITIISGTEQLVKAAIMRGSGGRLEKTVN
jgi:hypothetical protein